MSIADDLKALDDLRSKGTLTESEFQAAKLKLLGAPPGTLHMFRRSTEDHWVGGVCGGLARAIGWPSLVVRAIVVALVALAPSKQLVHLSFEANLLEAISSFVVLMYLAIWIFAPEDSDVAPGSDRKKL